MRIAVHAFDGVTMFHLSIPQMVFGTVSRLGLANWRVSLFTTDFEPAPSTGDSTDSACTDRADPAQPSDPATPAASPPSASIRTSEGYVLSGLGGPDLAGEADVVVVPAWFADGRPAGRRLRSLLKAAHARGASVVGLCLGAIPLAEAGLIGERRAVTHWRAFEPLAREHPEIALDESVLYVDHGDVLTSAGAASGLDACLHLVRTRLGAQAANEVARQLVIAPHREGGQAQYIGAAGAAARRRRPDRPHRHLGAGAPGRAAAGGATGEDGADEHPLLIRAFREATGAAPAAWVRAQRVREAQRLLESTDLAVEQVAPACGFGSTVTMRQAFAQALGTTPSAYRRRFRAASPDPAGGRDHSTGGSTTSGASSGARTSARGVGSRPRLTCSLSPRSPTAS